MLNKIKIKKLNMITLLRQLVISLLNSKNYAGQRRHLKDRSSRPKVFCKKGVLKNFTKFTGNHLRQSLFLNKVVCLRPVTLLKKRLWRRCFPVNFVNFLFYRTPPVAASTKRRFSGKKKIPNSGK